MKNKPKCKWYISSYGLKFDIFKLEFVERGERVRNGSLALKKNHKYSLPLQWKLFHD